MDDLLIEIQSEELPPKAMLKMRNSFASTIANGLHDASLNYRSVKGYVSPRRLAVLVCEVEAQQKDKIMERRGPSVEQAFGKDGNPSQACLGFLKSINKTLDDTYKIQTAKGEWLACKVEMPGKSLDQCIPDILAKAIKLLPVPKWMRWGNHNNEYARPVHGLIAMHGKRTLNLELFGFKSGNVTSGHRIHHPKPVTIKNACDYAETLRSAHVIADFDERMSTIREQLLQLDLDADIDNDLLEEVSNIVEWPVTLQGQFNKEFLNIPQEALITAMKEHQKSFPIVSDEGKMKEKFLFVSNLKSKEPKEVIHGNERVMTARLSDAKFFYDNDCKKPLIDFQNQLKAIIFQKGLGTLFDKVERLKFLARKCATWFSTDEADALRAAELSKCDLMTEMVYEFTELQGIMGYYYALNSGENNNVSTAIKEQYLPKFSGDNVAKNSTGIFLSVTDKIDNLVGLFGTNKAPTGAKDPFALRRAALGILRNLIENQIDIDLKELIQASIESYNDLENTEITTQLLDFFGDRFYVYLKERGYRHDFYEAVRNLDLSNPHDILLRVNAVKEFIALPEAEALCESNKRVKNILAKSESSTSSHVDEHLFEHEVEKTLHKTLKAKQADQQGDYTQQLKNLAALNTPLNNFFEHVMVNADDEKIRQNRLALLSEIRALFLNVADIAALQ